MPPKKKQKTATGKAKAAEESPAASKDNSKSRSSSPGTNKRDVTKIPKHEYICFPRPLFDFKSEVGEDDSFDAYKKAIDATKIYPDAAADHPDWKWIIQWNSWKLAQDTRRRASYCNPDNFGLNLYTDWEAWGLQELTDNLLFNFASHMEKKTDEGLMEMWSAVSGMGFWLMETNDNSFITNEDGEHVCECYGMIGCAILSALNAVDIAGELKADSKFKDLALVISYFLAWSEDLESYGVEEDEGQDKEGEWYEDVDPEEAGKTTGKNGGFDWRKQLVSYAKKARVDPAKGVYGTAKLLKKYDMDEDLKTPWQGRWRWDARWKPYKKRHEVKADSHRYDITKMSRKERAKAAYDGKDPLAGISAKDLREGNIMLG